MTWWPQILDLKTFVESWAPIQYKYAVLPVEQIPLLRFDNYPHSGISYTGKMISLYWDESEYWYGQNRLFVHLTAPLFVSTKLSATQ